VTLLITHSAEPLDRIHLWNAPHHDCSRLGHSLHVLSEVLR
jgi:hypothetical protein